MAEPVFADERARDEAFTSRANLEDYVLKNENFLNLRFKQRLEAGDVSDTSSEGVGQDEVDEYPSDIEDDGVEYFVYDEFEDLVIVEE